jgi:hypothetical protein
MSKHSDSNFDYFLESEGILEEVSAKAHKRFIALRLRTSCGKAGSPKPAWPRGCRPAGLSGIRNLFLPTRNVLALKAVEFRESLRPCRPMIVDHK